MAPSRIVSHSVIGVVRATSGITVPNHPDRRLAHGQPSAKGYPWDWGAFGALALSLDEHTLALSQIEFRTELQSFANASGEYVDRCADHDFCRKRKGRGGMRDRIRGSASSRSTAAIPPTNIATGF